MRKKKRNRSAKDCARELGIPSWAVRTRTETLRKVSNINRKSIEITLHHILTKYLYNNDIEGTAVYLWQVIHTFFKPRIACTISSRSTTASLRCGGGEHKPKKRLRFSPSSFASISLHRRERVVPLRQIWG